jgi:hypothetical protein
MYIDFIRPRVFGLDFASLSQARAHFLHRLGKPSDQLVDA